MSFQVGQVAGHVESDLESPGVSYGPKIFWSGEWLLINSSLCKSDTFVLSWGYCSIARGWLSRVEMGPGLRVFRLSTIYVRGDPSTSSGRTMNGGGPSTSSGRTMNGGDPSTSSGRTMNGGDPSTSSGRTMNGGGPSTSSGRTRYRRRGENEKTLAEMALYLGRGVMGW